MKHHGKKEKPNKSPRKYHLPSTSFFGFQPWIPHRQCRRLPCHLWCWHGANLTWKTAAGQGDISKFWPWKWEYSTYSSPLIVAHFSQKWPNVGEIIDYNTIIMIHWWFPPIRFRMQQFSCPTKSSNSLPPPPSRGNGEHSPGKEIRFMDIQRN